MSMKQQVAEAVPQLPPLTFKHGKGLNILWSVFPCAEVNRGMALLLIGTPFWLRSFT